MTDPKFEFYERIDGTKSWFMNGMYHKEDGPAVITDGGMTKEWWIKDMRHREDGPAIEKWNGTKEWWFNNLRHRIGGPAIEHCNGATEWFVNGKRHHEDGPAIEWGDKVEYWINDKLISPNKYRNVKNLNRCKYPKLVESIIIRLVHNS